MTRERLPDRRMAETATVVWHGTSYAVTIGFAADGRPLEVFCHGALVGSDLQATIDDGCVLLSLALQKGYLARELVKTLGKGGGGDGLQPDSILGVLACQVAVCTGRSVGTEQSPT